MFTAITASRQIIQTTLLQSYNSEIPLLQLIKYKVQAAWQEYVRVNCGNFQIDNRHQYLLLKKIAYLYYRKKGKNNSLSEIISEIAAELNLTEESVENYLVAVSTFKPKYNADFYASDDEDDFYSSAVDSVANDLDTEARLPICVNRIGCWLNMSMAFAQNVCLTRREKPCAKRRCC